MRIELSDVRLSFANGIDVLDNLSYALISKHSRSLDRPEEANPPCCV
jgi:hypothetical protein